MATERNRPPLHLAGEADSPSSQQEMPLRLLKRALPGATNDEVLELVYQVLENLGERAESAADFAIDSDNRDVENEAMVFIQEASKIPNSLTSPDRVRSVWYRIHDAKEDLGKAIGNRRQRLEGSTSLERFSHRRTRRIQSAWEVERRREQRQTTKLVERANVTEERVLEAIIRASEDSRAELFVKDVAIALMPELTDTSVVGRQRVIAAVSQAMSRMVKKGRIERIKPEGEREYDRRTSRYRLPVGGKGA